MPQVHYSPSAAQDLVELSEFIARDKPVAAYDWVDQIESTCQVLAKNPNIGQARQSHGFGACRSFTLGNYVIFFRGVEDGIEVIRIVRGERDLDRI
jgi:toxin ParE1/3/4